MVPNINVVNVLKLPVAVHLDFVLAHGLWKLMITSAWKLRGPSFGIPGFSNSVTERS